MKVLLCNPANTQGTIHSRKGMYVPLGMLSIATCLQNRFKDKIEIKVCDEDVEEMITSEFEKYDVVGFYSTTFNYTQAVRYAYFAKAQGCKTVLGGPHPTVLFENILKNRNCFDFIIKNEAEYPFVKIIEYLIDGNEDESKLRNINNLSYKKKGSAQIINNSTLINCLTELPIPSRQFVDFNSYVKNYRQVYPDRKDILPGSIYSSKGCSWRDKTGGCIFCARLEEGVNFRSIEQIWSEIEMLKNTYGVNYIWDIADDNLNNKEWFINFVEKRPKSCQDIKFFIYSRVTPIKPWVIDYFHRLNVEEVFLGIESGDDRLLKKSFKGQTRKSAINALKLLNENGIKFFPSFVLGLPGESKESLNNTMNLCKDIAELGGLDRISSTILKPIPGSEAYKRVIQETLFGKDLSSMDDVDLIFLEKYWIDQFANVSYETVLDYKNRINELLGDYKVFGSRTTESN